ncbi:MAG TPA: hypothetical protein VG273_12885 [Bryobacteraceae bacterium]|jgi:hypothetical protein|nr:hypothetical protein [Bryobacteraceae bacterium]
MKISTVLRRRIPVAAILICAAANVRADLIAVQNYSFEIDKITAGNYIGQRAIDWNFTGFVSTYDPANSEITGGAADGLNVAAVQGTATMSQVLTAVLQPYTTYTLTTEVGERFDIGSGGYRIAIDAGAYELAFDSSTAMVPGAFLTSTVTFVTGGSDPGLGQALSINVMALG